jgi:predicted metal-dependent HD superfamily phosphohydrolase
VSVDLNASWRRAWRGLGASTDGAPLCAALTAAYREPHRRYHSLQHLGECIDLFERVAGSAAHPAEVETGLWFHDAVYDPKRSDNEERSADWMRRAASADGVAADAAERCCALIMATRHDAIASGADARLLVDIDLAVLAAGDERFAEYERQIRAEYAFVPEAIFVERRRAILAAFLSRERIYSTPRLHDELEHRARANLVKAIAVHARSLPASRSPQPTP